MADSFQIKFTNAFLCFIPPCPAYYIIHGFDIDMTGAIIFIIAYMIAVIIQSGDFAGIIYKPFKPLQSL